MPPATPITGSYTIHPNNDRQVSETITYSEAEMNYINFRRMRLISARDMRDASHPEFDDMTFLQYYDVLKKADDQYVAPRKNAQDTSINLGTVRDKDTSLVEYAASHDFQPVAQVYDGEQDMYEDLAEVGEDLVQKSFMLEDFKTKSKLIHRSMIAFGTALVEDAYVQRWVIDKTMKEGYRAGMGSEKAEWEQRMRLQYEGCQAKLWDLRKCYFGDIRKFFMNGPQGQPYFFTVEYESYDVVKQLFGNWDRFKYVPNIVVSTPEVSAAQVFDPFWSLRPVSMNYVEIVRYYDPIANEFSITLNGVDMLPLMKKKVTKDGMEKTLVSAFPLTEVSPSAAIPFAKYDFEPMHDFAYSKGQPGKMRVLADIENMWTKLALIMFKQKVKPTMGNKSGRQFGPEVTDPATVINDIRDGDLFPVLPNYSGSTPSDFTFFEVIKKELDKNSVERSWQGSGPTQQDETATKSLNDQKAQNLLKVASMFDGIISGNKQLYWLRTYNIMKNWTKPIDVQVDTFKQQLVNVYRTVSLPTEAEGGQKAIKKIMFTKDTPMLKDGEKHASLEDSFDIYHEEMDHKDEKSQEMRFVKIHPELFSSIKLMWYYDCVPTPNSTDPLSYMVFAKQITDAMQMFGPDSLNVKRLKHRFAALTGNDFDTWFISEQELQNNRAQAAANPPAPGADGGAKVPGKTSGAGPSISEAVGAGKPALSLGRMMQ